MTKSRGSSEFPSVRLTWVNLAWVGAGANDSRLKWLLLDSTAETPPPSDTLSWAGFEFINSQQNVKRLIYETGILGLL